MIPQTVPNESDERGDARDGREKRYVAFELGELDGGGTQQRAVDGIETPQGRTSGGRGRLCRVGGRRLPQLRVHFGVPGLKETDERAVLERRTHCLHFGELAALAEDVEERRGLSRRATQDGYLVEGDSPTDRREREQDEKDAQRQPGAVKNQPDDVGTRAQLAGPSIRLRRLRKERNGGDWHVQTALRD